MSSSTRSAPPGRQALESRSLAGRKERLHLGRAKTKDLPGYLVKATTLEVEPLANRRSGLERVKGARLVAEVDTGIPVSGLTQLRTGETLVVRDDSGIYAIRPGQEPRKLIDQDGLEGITVDDDGKYVYAVREEGGSKKRDFVHRYEMRADDRGRVALRESGKPRPLPEIKRVANKGWEGLAFLAKEKAGGRHDLLVCVHEGKPRRLGFYRLPDLDGETVRPPKEAKHLLDDLADVAIDPRTGHLFVVSDITRTVVELKVKPRTRASRPALVDTIEIAAISSIELPLSGKQKPEALHFDARGRLWVGLDYEKDRKNEGAALVLELER